MCLQGLDSAYEQALRTGTVVMPWSKHVKMTYVDLRDLKTLVADDMPAGAPPPDQPEGLGPMFANYNRHGFHGGNALALRTIRQRETRSVAD
jgi:hypothetical protein